jgi:flagellar basal-body rod modification protein FlgD
MIISPSSTQTPFAARAASGSTATGTTGSSTAASNANSTVSETQFLQLLTEQLQNQDPLQPTDDTQFLAEMAQFSNLQETNTLNQTQEKVNANALIGLTVTAAPAGVTPVTGTVTAVDTSQSDPSVVINGTEYPYSSITLVQPASAAPTGAGSSSPSS